MEQNINLLNSLPSAQLSKYTDLKFLLFVLGGFLGLLLLIYLVNFGLYEKAVTNLKQLATTKEEATKQIILLKQQLNISNIEDIDKISPGPKRSQLSGIEFASYLEKLAQHVPYGVWLNNIVFNQKMNVLDFTLDGKALSAMLLPQFIKLIEQQHIFSKESPINLKMKKNEKENFMEFTLSSK